MGNQCTGTRVQSMISCIDFKKTNMNTKDTKDFPNEDELLDKIDKYVHNYHQESRKKYK